jgi:phosphoribosylformylglycinamidine cyclo-ligase
MPGVYKSKECDVVGMITGVVEKKKVILGQDIIPGDQVFAFSSSGLHTNGYSLARYLLLEKKQWSLDKIIDGMDQPLGEILLTPHINYCKPVHYLLKHRLAIKAMAHITGGGIVDNLPRVLPPNCSVEIKKATWPIPEIFWTLQEIGPINEWEMYRTFNMGIGFVLIGDSSLLAQANQLLHPIYPLYKLHRIGEVVEGAKEIRLCA